MRNINIRRLTLISVWLMRLVVGIVFVLSGFAKAIDPWGTVYKITEYVNMLGMQQLLPLVNFGAFALPVVEFLLGIFLTFGLYRRFATFVFLLLMLVMTPLTGYLAFTDRMADCGCFGDVLVLTNWQSFAKNVVLLLCALVLCRFNRRAKNIYGYGVQWMVWTLSMIFVLVVEYYGYFIQPLVDFRPFKVGTKLYDGPKYNADEDADDKFVFIYKKDGVEREFKLDSLPDDTWEYVDRRTADAAPEEPAEQLLTIFDGGFDRTAELLDEDGEQLIFTFPDFEHISIASTYLLNELNEFAQEHGVTTFGLTSGNAAQVAEWNDISMAKYPIYACGDTEMKMLVRGNPAVVYVKDGEVKWKRTLLSLKPDLLNRAGADMMSINSDFDAGFRLRWLSGTYGLLLLLLLVANRLHVVAKIAYKRLRKNAKKDVTLQADNEANEEKDEIQ